MLGSAIKLHCSKPQHFRIQCCYAYSLLNSWVMLHILVNICVSLCTVWVSLEELVDQWSLWILSMLKRIKPQCLNVLVWQGCVSIYKKTSHVWGLALTHVTWWRLSNISLTRLNRYLKKEYVQPLFKKKVGLKTKCNCFTMEKCQGLSVIMISALRENCPAQASLTLSAGERCIHWDL